MSSAHKSVGERGGGSKESVWPVDVTHSAVPGILRWKMNASVSPALN